MQADGRPVLNYWIFQANPKYYDIDTALADLDRIEWRVPQYTDRVGPADQVLIWRSGKESGIVGLGTVLTNPALRDVPEHEKRYVANSESEGGAETRVTLKVLPVGHIPKDVVAELVGMSDHLIIRAPMGTVFPVVESQWLAVAALVGTSPPEYEKVEDPVASSAWPAPFSWDDRRRDAYPLPGGYDGYLDSLRLILDLVQRQRPSIDDLTEALQGQFKLSPTNARHVSLFIRRVGLIKETSGLLEVGESGRQFLETDDKMLVIAQLHSRIRFFGEMLRLLEAEPKNADQLLEAANDLFATGWTTKAQIMRRRGWLQSAGAITVDDDGRFLLSEQGRALASELACQKPSAASSNPTDTVQSVAKPSAAPSRPAQPLPQSVPEQIVERLTTTSTASDSPDDFEKVIGEVFGFLGYEAEWLGGPGKTDVIADADLGLDDSYRVIIDGKTSAKGAIPDAQIDWDTIDDHKREHKADFVVIAGPAFTGDRLRQRAIDHGAVLLTAADLGDLVRQHAASPLGLDSYRPLFESFGDAELEVLADAVEQRDRLVDITLACLREIEGHVSEVGALSARDLFLLLRNSTDLDAAETEIADALDGLASPLLEMLTSTESGYRPSGPRTTAVQRFSILSRLLAEDDRFDARSLSD